MLTEERRVSLSRRQAPGKTTCIEFIELVVLLSQLALAPFPEYTSHNIFAAFYQYSAHRRTTLDDNDIQHTVV